MTAKVPIVPKKDHTEDVTAHKEAVKVHTMTVAVPIAAVTSNTHPFEPSVTTLEK